MIGSLTGPIINRIAINAEIMRLNVLQKQSLLEYEQTINNTVQEVDQEIKNLCLLETKYILKSKAKDVMTSSVNVSSEFFRTHRTSYLEVLIAGHHALH
ncbi:MAG: hypothetical protein ACK5AO_09665 [bacterium]